MNATHLHFWRPGHAEEFTTLDSFTGRCDSRMFLTEDNSSVIVWSQTGQVQKWDVASQGMLFKFDTPVAFAQISSVSVLH